MTPTGTFAPVARLVNGERIVVLGWARAILLQLAHPLVAAGVDEHSTFRRTRLARFTRLHETVQAMLGLTFGDEATATRVAGGINTIHDRVRGTLREAVGPFPAGAPYSARDPELLRWVHATLLDTLPRAYECWVGPLTADTIDAYCAEAVAGAVRLGVQARDVPHSRAETTRYVERMIASGAIAVSPPARTLAREVLHPPGWRAMGPVSALTRLFAIGTLPVAVREMYGFSWRERDAQRLDRLSSWARRGRGWLPAGLARFRAAGLAQAGSPRPDRSTLHH